MNRKNTPLTSDELNQINLVKNGYNEIAEVYRKQKDEHLIKTGIFQKWIELYNKTKFFKPILDLGCGSGYPIGKYMLENGYSYLGIDYSSSQIQLCKSTYPEFEESFQEAEIVDFCRSKGKNSYGGMISLHSLFHIPRQLHLEIFYNLFLILEKDAPILFTAHSEGGEGYDNNWLGIKMYWSHFSCEWYLLTLTELGFRHVETFTETRTFCGEDETTIYILFQK